MGLVDCTVVSRQKYCVEIKHYTSNKHVHVQLAFTMKTLFATVNMSSDALG